MRRPPYRLGAKPSRPDPRDYIFAARSYAPAAAALDRRLYTMVGPDFRIAQGAEGTCVGHAATNLLMAGPSEHDSYASFQTEEEAHQFARKLYLEGSGDTTYQKGMAPQDACKTLLNWGLIDSYWRVWNEDITTALLTFGPLIITVPWYYSMFYDHRALSKVYGNWWIRLNMESDFVGYHELCLTGIDLDPADGAPPWVRIENSWGKSWGYNGTARLTIENLRRLVLSDNWTCAEKVF